MLTEPECFGSELDYYSGEQDRVSKLERNIELSDKLASIIPNLQNEVKGVYKKWNQQIREAIRFETGLKFNFGEERQTIPVRLIDGFDQDFYDLVKRPDPDWWRIYLNRKLFEQAVKSLDFANINFDTIIKILPSNKNSVSKDNIMKTKDFMEELSNIQSPQLPDLQYDIIARVRQIRKDFLGAYFFKIPEIQLYWSAIGITANIIGAPVDGLSFVVLAHELCHAYTHHGRDIDGDSWDTIIFADSDDYLVEGLAQYYTRAVCERFESSFPNAIKAFNNLLDCQHEVYTEFVSWHSNSNRSSEAVRYSMLRARKHNIKKYAQFRAVIIENNSKFATAKS